MTLTSRIPLILGDTFVVIITWIKSYGQFKAERRLGIHLSLSTLLFRDGELAPALRFHILTRTRNCVLYVSCISYPSRGPRQTPPQNSPCHERSRTLPSHITSGRMASGINYFHTKPGYRAVSSLGKSVGLWYAFLVTTRSSHSLEHSHLSSSTGSC